MPKTRAAGKKATARTAEPGREDGARGEASGEPPYRAEAVRGDGHWHLNVRSLDDHPDRGEVDALVVTVTPRRPGDDFPAADLDRTLGECGFRREGEWARESARWTAPCTHPFVRAAPPAPAAG
ncbi:hypothetical protein AB0399_36010 [Streptomyces sp. NPDC088194]|uniref:hypothetical protein n=1 Tax=Streptomyces sp. NPDC088194 TaxID=3154931 RepID=UPI003450F37A